MGDQKSRGGTAEAVASDRKPLEWPTLAALVGAYALFACGLFLWSTSLWLISPIILALTAAFHGSLQHETIHGHPTGRGWLDEALVSLPLMGVYPYRRYRSLHLKHHHDASLTDPYDDPESYFWPPELCSRMSRPMLWLLEFNNTLVGRLLIGPALGIVGFIRTEWPRIVSGEPGVRLAWALHGLGLIFLWLIVVEVAAMPWWVYVMFVSYPALSLTLLRSFAEHQAAEEIGHRSAIVETGAPFSLLYLNNNLHFVHHSAPTVAWYDLPELYRERYSNYLAANGGYRFDGYGEIVRRFALRRKQPVAFPLAQNAPPGDESPS